MKFSFRNQKNEKNIKDLISELTVYQKLIEYISRSKSMLKLNRINESQEIFANAESLVSNYLNQNPHEVKAYIMLILLYLETNNSERAEPIIKRLLNSDEFELNEDEHLILSSELQKILRQRPLKQRTQEENVYSQIYCCAKCGRFHNFVSLPCPHCNWIPSNIEETARSLVLSTTHLKVPSLLLVSREMAKQREIENIIPNLIENTQNYLSNAKQRQVVDQIFSLIEKDEHKNYRTISMIRKCPNCGDEILGSNLEACLSCNTSINWPDTLHILSCMDNLLYLFEQRVEVSSDEAFSDFVCLLVVMTNNLLRKQEIPTKREMDYSLKLLSKMVAISDLNKGAVIGLDNLDSLEIYLVKENMRDDSESYGTFLYRELEFFISKMKNGIKY